MIRYDIIKYFGKLYENKLIMLVLMVGFVVIFSDLIYFHVLRLRTVTYVLVSSWPEMLDIIIHLFQGAF